MPAGPIIDGKEVLAAGTYVVRSVEDALTLPGGAGNIVLVGDIPVLEKGRVYRFTSRTALETGVAPNDPTIKLLSKLVYESSKPTTPKPPPASVSLVSVNPTTQATGLVPTQALDNVKPLLKAKIWGPRGNTTVAKFSPRLVVGGVRATISNMGLAQVIDVPAVPAALTITYTEPTPVPLPPNAYGFGNAGDGTGVVSAGNDPSTNGIYIAFAKTITDMSVNTAGAAWTPGGPVVGPLAITVLAGATITTATSLTITITGTDTDGVPQVEILTNTPDDTINGEWDVDITTNGVVNWSSVTSVDVATNVAGTFAGNVRIDGLCYRTAARDISIAEVIREISTIGGGFSASTGFGNVSSIPQAQVDRKAATTLPATFSAECWSLVETINAQSSYATVDMTGRNFVPIAPAWSATTSYADDDVVSYNTRWYRSLQAANVGKNPATEAAWWGEVTELVVVLAGGTQSTVVQQDWQDAFDELLYHRIEGRVPLTTNINILREVFIPHLNSCWREYQVPATGYVGVAEDQTFDALRTLSVALDSERIQRCFEAPTVVMPNGTTREQPPWALAVQMASAANGKRADSLDRWQPNVVSLRRNASISGPLFNDDIIRLGYSTFFGYAQTSPRLLLECTGWVTDNNALRTQAGAVRSAVDVHTYVKDIIDAAIAASGSTDGLRGALEGILDQALDTLKTNGTIVDYREIDVQEYSTFFNAKFKYMPRGTKSYVIVEAQASFAFLQAA